MPTAFMGLVSMVVILVGSLFFSAENVMMYVAPLSFIIVMGCTVGSAFLQFPFQELKMMVSGMKRSLFGKVPPYEKIVKELVEIAIAVKSNKPMDEIKGMTKDTLTTQGLVLIENELPLDKIYYILNQQLIVMQTDDKKVSNMFSSLGKLPPTFGMMGTVIGLVGLLGSIGGEGGGNIGTSMAIALITTLYGVIIANFMFDPVASNLKLKQEHMLTAQKIILKGMVLAADPNVTTIEIQEVLNAYLNEEKKVDVIKI